MSAAQPGATEAEICREISVLLFSLIISHHYSLSERQALVIIVRAELLLHY